MLEPRLIGQGGYGCVFKPSLKCNEKKSKNFYLNKVSKATYRKNAITEQLEQSKIDKLDKKYLYHLRPPKICTMRQTDRNRCRLKSHKPTDTLLILEDGGLSLYDFVKEITLTYNPDKLPEKTKQEMIYNFWVNSINLVDFLVILKKKGLFHNDLKPENILFHMTSYKLNVIDFGLMDSNVDYPRSSHWHFSYPPESVFFKMNEYEYNKVATLNDYDFRKFFTPFISTKYSDFVFYVTQKTYTTDYKVIYGFNNQRWFYNCLYEHYIKNKSHTEVIECYKNTMDIYGLGMALMHVFVKTYYYLEFNDDEKKIQKDLFITKMYKLLLSMIHPNCFNRITIEKLLPEYRNLIEMLKRNNKSHPTNPSPTHYKTGNTPPNPLHKTCVEGKELNIATNRCRKKCEPGYYRNPTTQRCNKTKILKTKKCKDDEELNIKTNRCRKKCRPGFYRNSITQRCNKIK